MLAQLWDNKQRVYHHNRHCHIQHAYVAYHEHCDNGPKSFEQNISDETHVRADFITGSMCTRIYMIKDITCTGMAGGGYPRINGGNDLT